MDNEQYLNALRRDAPALLDAVRAADPATTIAACPEWTPIDLVWHIGEVHRFWGTVAGERLQEPPADWPPPRPPTPDGVLAFAGDSIEVLVGALTSTDAATPVWTWSPDHHDVAFVIRRMAQETAVHRVDAERAAGRDHRIEADLAADGIDEFLFRFLPAEQRDEDGIGGSVHVHCTDTEGEWTVTPDAGGRLAVSTGHAKGDVAIRGAAHDLLMALWRRDGTERLEVFGDPDVAERFLALTDLE